MIRLQKTTTKNREHKIIRMGWDIKETTTKWETTRSTADDENDMKVKTIAKQKQSASKT